MNKFEEIKAKYLKSNKYCLFLDYEDIEFLILKIETENVKKKIIRKNIRQKIHFCKKLDDSIYKEYFIEILKNLLLTI